MRQLNSVTLTVLGKAEDDFNVILAALQQLAFSGSDPGKTKCNVIKAKGFNEKTILICEIELKNQAQLRDFTENLRKILTEEQKQLLLRQIDTRLDDDCNFYIRFDKEKLLEGTYWITDSGTCFHVKLNLACFPKKRDKGVAVVNRLFS